MKLAAKLISALLAGTLLLLATDAYVSLRNEIAMYEADMQQDALHLGRAMKDVVADVWRSGGREKALQLIEDVNREEHAVRLHWTEPARRSSGLAAPDSSSEAADDGDAGERAVWRRGGGHSDTLRTYVPVLVEGRPVGAIEIAEPRTTLDHHIQGAILRRLGLVVLLLAVSAGVVLILGFVAVGRPLNRLVDTTRRMGSGDLLAPIDLREHDELDELAQALGAMGRELAASRDRLQVETAQRIAALEQLRHADRLRTVGRLASGIAHELGTPLNVVSGRATMIASGELAPPEVVTSAEVIRDQAGRMTRIVRQLLDFARRQRAERAGVDLRQCADEARNLLDPLSRKKGVSIAVAGAPVQTLADPMQIAQALTNLIVNAIQASESGAEVSIEVGRENATPPPAHGTTPGSFAFVRVADRGQGIAEADIQRIFEPFYTTKDVGEGTGLGLSIAYSIAVDHGGWIDVRSQPGEGSVFTFYLPEA